jgi:photosystem II stability/assembly factor-like uncharacterized protein
MRISVVIQRTILGLIAAVALVYAGDYLWARHLMAGGNSAALGSVMVHHEWDIPRKDVLVATKALAQYTSARNAVFDFSCDALDHCWATLLRDPMTGNRAWYFVRTDDGGKSWKSWRQSPGMAQVFFITPESGWGLSGSADSQSLAETSDGGQTWRLLPPLPHVSPKTSDLIVQDFQFLDSRNGWIIGSRSGGLSYLARTTDGGESAKIGTEISEEFGVTRAIATASVNRVWLFGNDSILYSEDSGQTWKQQVDKNGLRVGALTIESARMRADGHGIAVGETGGAVILKTDDFGQHWRIALQLDIITSLMDVTFWDDNHGCAVGRSTMLYCTEDGGTRWTGRDVLPEVLVNGHAGETVFTKIAFLRNGQRGWAIRELGYLYETNDGGASWHELDLLSAAGQ